MSIETEEWRDPEFRIPLFQQGSFKLNSGALSAWKIECDSLTDEDWDGVAAMARQLVPQFSEVIGVPRGGSKLEERLKPFAQIGVGPKLLVDDVLTTGGSITKMYNGLIDAVPEENWSRSRPYILGVVLFARGQCPWWVKAIFSMPEVFWLKPVMRGT